MSVRERYQGFAPRWSAGLSWPPEMVMYGDYQREFGQRVAPNRFVTAVFAASDYLVLGLLDGLRASGLRAPGAPSLVASMTPTMPILPSRISTIRQPAREWAALQ